MDLTINKIEENKQEFISLLKSTNRDGIDNLIDWLCNKSDFFTAPSSTIYHCNYPGGLCQHSLNVYYAAKEFLEVYKHLCLPEKNANAITEDSVIICALLHDLCKTNYYAQTEKWIKDNDTNTWIKYFSYTIDDKFPMGHGEKSVFMITRFLQLSGIELLSVRWHMHSHDIGHMISNYQKPPMQTAMEKYPLCVLIAQADYFASYCMEEQVDQTVVNRIM